MSYVTTKNLALNTILSKDRGRPGAIRVEVKALKAVTAKYPRALFR